MLSFKKTSSSDRSVMWRNCGQDDRRQMVNGGGGGKRAILYSVSVSRGRLHFFKRSAQLFSCHVFQEVDSDIQSTPGPGRILNSGKFARGKNKEKARMNFSVGDSRLGRCFVWRSPTWKSSPPTSSVSAGDKRTHFESHRR